MMRGKRPRVMLHSTRGRGGGASIQLLGIRPARQTGHGVELPEQPADQLVGIGLLAERFEPRDHPGQGFIRVTDRSLGKVLPLPRETLAMLEELRAVKI